MAAVVLCTFALSACAQWQTESRTLRPGWNAVYLTVTPHPSECDDVFAALPQVESVWKWNRYAPLVQFGESPLTLFPEDDHWLTWLPPSHPQAFVRNLVSLRGGEAYLVKVSDAAAAFEWSIKGRPGIARIEWLPDSFNLVGLPVNAVNPPTFADYFESTPPGIDLSPGNRGQVHRIDQAGEEREIVQTARAQIEPGAAYWVKCDHFTPFSAPLEVTPSTAGGVDFGRTLNEQDVEIRNVSSTRSMTVQLRLLPSEPAPPGLAEVAGDVQLSYFVGGMPGEGWEWVPLTNTLTHSLGPGAEWVVRLGVRRGDFEPYAPLGTNGAAYQSVLEIADAEQSIRLLVPVSAETQTVRLRSLAAGDGDAPPAHHHYEGLWIGQASINEVSRPLSGTADTEPTASAFSFRLLVHVDEAGRARLLQRVVLAGTDRDEVTVTTNRYEGELLVTTSSVEYVDYRLYADERDVPPSVDQAYRVSSAAFPLCDPVAMTGDMGGQLRVDVVLPYDSLVSPFVHAHHPDHDNLDEDYSATALAEGVESFSVVRSVTLAFSTNEIPATGYTFWGTDETEGEYREIVRGLRKEPIHVRGVFGLERIMRDVRIEGE